MKNIIIFKRIIFWKNIFKWSWRGKKFKIIFYFLHNSFTKKIYEEFFMKFKKTNIVLFFYIKYKEKNIFK